MLYLVRHAEAAPRQPDGGRVLTPHGRAQAERIASALAYARVRVDRIVHSGAKRATQTAEILAAPMTPRPTVERVDGLEPLDPTDAFAAMVKDLREDLVAVGHLPFLDLFTTRLVTSREAPSVVSFSPATLVALQKEEEAWRIHWVVRPNLPNNSA